MRTKLLATAAIAALCFGGPAFADESEALINQSGVSNNADIDQTEGLENEGYIDQTGDENSASITQKHTPPGSQIYSIATNTADIDQTSAVGAAVGNSATVTQTADTVTGAAPNSVDIDQNTAGSLAQTASVDQVGGQGNSVTVAQGLTDDTGGEVATVSQEGNDNSAVVAQDGTGDTTTVAQLGDANAASVTQTGSDNNSTVDQIGNDNDSTVTQNAIGAYADNDQTGDNNVSTIAQTDDSSNGTINIPNADPESTVIQAGNNNTSTVDQIGRAHV